jgi:hypothetical protein
MNNIVNAVTRRIAGHGGVPRQAATGAAQGASILFGDSATLLSAKNAQEMHA